MSAAGWEWGTGTADMRWSVWSPSGRGYTVSREAPTVRVCGARCCWVVMPHQVEPVWSGADAVVWVGPDLWITPHQPPRRQVERVIERWERERARGGGK